MPNWWQQWAVQIARRLADVWLRSGPDRAGGERPDRDEPSAARPVPPPITTDTPAPKETPPPA